MLPWNYAQVSGFCIFWETSYEARLSASISNEGQKSNRIFINKEVSTFGEITLHPEQEGCYRAMYDAMFVERRIVASLQDGHTGAGKTIIGGAMIARLVADGLLTRRDMLTRMHPIMVFAPTGVPVENWKRELERMGLGELVAKRKIFVVPDSIFQTEFGDSYCSIEEDYVTGETKMIWNPMMVPYYIIIDECHRYVRENAMRTKKMLALLTSDIEHYATFMSATPVEKVNDARLFAIACHTRFMDMEITVNSWKDFALTMDATPQYPNAAACKRLRSVFAGHIFSLPYVKPKFKAVNRVVIIDFLNAQHRKVYDTAHTRYIEACRKTGKNTEWGQLGVLVALNNFLKTAEPLRAWWIAETAARNFKEGRLATAVFCGYKETIAEVAFRLVDQYGIPRDKISIIWGGKREYKTQEMLSLEEFQRLQSDPDFMAEIGTNKVLRKRAMLTMKYMQDQLEHSESADEQAYRHEKLMELKLLGKQSVNARMIEVDNFQDGTTEICLATTATGGVNLSLDRSKEHLKPRMGLYTPPFSGKVYLQALGRLVRRQSLSDAEQLTAMLRGTVEEYHVAPILDEKLKSMAEFTGRTMETIIDLLSNDIPIVEAPVHLRSVEEAIADAEKDDTLVSEHLMDDDDEDEDEELATL